MDTISGHVDMYLVKITSEKHWHVRWPRMIICKFFKIMKNWKNRSKQFESDFVLNLISSTNIFWFRFDLNLTLFLKLIWNWFAMYFILMFPLVAEDYHWPTAIICWYDELSFLIRSPWRRAILNIYFFMCMKYV